MKMNKILVAAFAIVLTLTMVNCSKDDVTGPSGYASFSITDAPSDDSNIKGSFITVSDIKVDGISVKGFTKQTIEISAYQNGNAKELFKDKVEVGSYNDVTLILDHEKDENGNEPGSYVLTNDNKKHKLAASSNAQTAITLNKQFELKEDSTVNFVLDFDLRKSIVRDSSANREHDYKFVTSAEMHNAVRVVNKDNYAEIKGKVTTSVEPNANVYVFAYKKGEYNESVEKKGKGESGVLFAGAVTSAKVDNSGNYQFSFLEEGNYEVHVAQFSQDSNGKYGFSGMFGARSKLVGVLLNNISLTADARVELDIELEGNLGLFN